MAAPVELDEVRAVLARSGPPVDPSVVDEFFSRLDPAYFAEVTPSEVAAHVRMAAALGPSVPARVAVTPVEGDRHDVTVVAFDYFAEFSLICGLFAASRLDIESGHVHTFAPRRAVPRPAPGRPVRRAGPTGAPLRKIVDVFRVVPRDGVAPDAATLESGLCELLALVGEGHMDVARERLNRRVAESLSAAAAEGGGAADARVREALAPLEIAFDNQAAARWTVMDVRGHDTPAFLYALANALALRGFYVHRVHIESVGDEARDRFWIAHRDGGKVQGEDEQRVLRVAVALIKQFTHLLPWAPDPALALRDFDQFVDRAMAEGPEALRVLGNRESLLHLARLLGSSAFLWEDFLRNQFEHLRPVLREWSARPLLDREALRRELLDRRVAAPAERKRAFNEFKDEQMLLIDMKHLLDPSVTLERFAEALTDLAEAVVEEAAAVCHAALVERHGRPLQSGGGECRFALLGLGKFGGRELGYASDLELLPVYGGPGRTEKTGIDNGQFFDELVHDLTEFMEAREEGIFHVDLRLRPHGRKGPVASSLDAVRDYYRPGGGAAAFERQALIKLRPVAGDAVLARAVADVRDAFVWSEQPWDRENARHLRERQVQELVPRGRFNVKYSRGALVDVEYSVQYLQIQHGRARLELRTPSTREALDRLRDAGLLSAGEHRDLAEGYVFWRRVADALRMVRGNARDLLLPPPGSPDLGVLARRLGYAGTWTEVAEALTADVRRHRARIREIFEERFG
jgi:glutamate-ammonia-ligase adenylyltransferase